MNIIEAIQDDNLFRPFLGNDLSTWRPWMCALRATYGLPVQSVAGRRLVRQCTGRDPVQLPTSGFDTALFKPVARFASHFIGQQRSGKDRA